MSESGGWAAALQIEKAWLLIQLAQARVPVLQAVQDFARGAF